LLLDVFADTMKNLATTKCGSLTLGKEDAAMQNKPEDVPRPTVIFLGFPLIGTIHGIFKATKTWKRFGRKRIFVNPPKNVALFFENNTIVFAHIPSCSAKEIKKLLARTAGPIDIEFHTTTEIDGNAVQQTLATVIIKLKSMT
jgi:hypothetical protein